MGPQERTPAATCPCSHILCLHILINQQRTELRLNDEGPTSAGRALVQFGLEFLPWRYHDIIEKSRCGISRHSQPTVGECAIRSGDNH